jgi:hypothetical protein
VENSEEIFDLTQKLNEKGLRVRVEHTLICEFTIIENPY